MAPGWPGRALKRLAENDVKFLLKCPRNSREGFVLETDQPGSRLSCGPKMDGVGGCVAAVIKSFFMQAKLGSPLPRISPSSSTTNVEFL